MSIYKPNGETVTEAFNVSGQSIQYAYNINGEVVFQNPYNNFTDTALYSVPSGNNQGFDFYNDQIFQYMETAHTLKLIGYDDGTVSKTLSTNITDHGNDVTVSQFFYDAEDEYPVVFMGNGIGLRLNADTNTATKVYNMNIPHGEGKSGWVNYGSAFNGNTMYTIGYSTSYSDTSSLVFIEAWDLSEDIENPALISQVTRPWVVCIQGAAYYDGLLWCACGIGVQATGAHIYAFNPTDASIAHDLVLDHHNELEGIAWANKNGEDFIIYGEHQKKYHKITFGS